METRDRMILIIEEIDGKRFFIENREFPDGRGTYKVYWPERLIRETYKICRRGRKATAYPKK